MIEPPRSVTFRGGSNSRHGEVMPKAVYTHSIADASLHESIIRTILTIQKAQHDGKWNTAETLHGLAAAAAYFCQEIVQQLGPESGDPVGDLAGLIRAKMGDPQPAPAESRAPQGATLH
jgi:hypothetical protein